MRHKFLFVLLGIILVVSACSTDAKYTTRMSFNPICLSRNTGVDPSIDLVDKDDFAARSMGSYTWTMGSESSSRVDYGVVQTRSSIEIESNTENTSNVDKMAAMATLSNPSRVVNNIRIAASCYANSFFWAAFQSAVKIKATGQISELNR